MKPDARPPQAPPFANETPEELEAALQRAEADVAAGRVIPHEEVVKWLKTWGTPDEQPIPREWLR